MGVSTTTLLLRKNELEREIRAMLPVSDMTSGQRITWYCAYARKDEIEKLMKESEGNAK